MFWRPKLLTLVLWLMMVPFGELHPLDLDVAVFAFLTPHQQAVFLLKHSFQVVALMR